MEHYNHIPIICRQYAFNNNEEFNFEEFNFEEFNNEGNNEEGNNEEVNFEEVNFEEIIYRCLNVSETVDISTIHINKNSNSFTQKNKHTTEVNLKRFKTY